MNIPGITRALELDDADWDLAVKLRGLTEHQREQFSAALGPIKSSKKSTTKKPAGKGGGGKSKHASSLAEKVGGTLASIAKTVGNDDEGAQKVLNAIEDSVSDRCQFMSPAGGHCGGTRDDNKHHLHTRADYHQFVASPATRTGKSDAQSAAGGS